ncbi:hypothetical protein [Streptomyces sp. NPDC058964]|uniref:hypothetical protein n=1 Tax=Streptomyces sp. NPDC058964 TaxID=3346681 RepID=UPI0036B32566
MTDDVLLPRDQVARLLGPGAAIASRRAACTALGTGNAAVLDGPAVTTRCARPRAAPWPSTRRPSARARNRASRAPAPRPSRTSGRSPGRGVKAVRPRSPDPAHRVRSADTLAAEPDVPVHVTCTAEDAVAGASPVAARTLGTTPVVRGERPAPGCTVVGVGIQDAAAAWVVLCAVKEAGT